MKQIITFFFSVLLMAQAAIANTPRLSAKEIVGTVKLEMELAGSDQERSQILDNHVENLRPLIAEMSTQEAKAFQIELLKSAHPLIAKDLTELTQVIDFEKLGPQEQADIILQIAQSHGLNGASWTGEQVGMAIGVTLGILIVGFMASRVVCLAIAMGSTERPRCAGGR